MAVNALLVTGRLAGHRPRLPAAGGPERLGGRRQLSQGREAADIVVETIAKGGGRSIAVKGDVAIEAHVLGMFDRRPRRWERSPRSSPTPASSRPRRGSRTLAPSACAASSRSMSSAPISPPTRLRDECPSPLAEREAQSSRCRQPPRASARRTCTSTMPAPRARSTR